MKVLIIGLTHDVQSKDPTGHFLRLLESLLQESEVELIAEEAHKLPTTVGQRLACRLNLPWLNMDMDEAERKKARISGKIGNRRPAPLEDFDAPPGSFTFAYLDREDGAREQHWISRVAEQKVSSAIMVCGLMHVSPLAEKVRELGWVAEELNVCELDWYIANFGTAKSVEENGQRYFEYRPATKHGGS